jgi:hypothetical protein
LSEKEPIVKAGKNPRSFISKATGFIRHMKFKRAHVYFFILSMAVCNLIQGQDSLLMQRISIQDTTLTIRQAFKLISNRTSLNFSYNPDAINISRSTLLSGRNETLHTILDRLLDDPSLEFRIIGRHIVIFRPIILNRSGSGGAFPVKDSVSILEIKGRVMDKQTRQPLPFSNISLIGKSIGTVANLQGNFLLKISTRYLQDSLGISCMGYKRLILPVTDYIKSQQDYYLYPDIIPIQEVIIRTTNPVALLRSAIEKIPKNYPVHPFLMTSFYREIIRKNSRPVAVSEAILQTFKTSYAFPVSGDQIKIIKGRKTKDINSSDSLILKLKAGLNTTLLLDVVKNLPEFLSEEGFHIYSYKMTDIIVNDQNEIYTIQFSPKEGYPDAFYQGRIFLDIKSLAITEVDFEVDPMKIEDAGDRFVLKKPRYIKVKPLKAQYRVTFRKIDDKYYLNFIRCETAFRIRHKNQLFGSVYNTILEMAVTQLETSDVERFRIKETAKSQEIFMEQITGFDDSFWGEYNFIKPEVPLEEAIQHLSGE